MNTRTYILSSDTLAAGLTGVDIYETGRTNLTISLAGVTDYTEYHYTKFIVDFGDGSDQQIIQHSTNTKSLSSKSISHTFNPTDSYVATYNIGLSGLTSDMTVDTYTLNLNVGKSHITDYKSIKIIDAQLYTTPAGKNNVMLTVEAQNPRFVGNIIIPFEDVDVLAAGVGTLVTPSEISDDVHLRTEQYSTVGGYHSIIYELNTPEHRGAFMIREGQLYIFIVGNEIVSQWSGQSSAQLARFMAGIDESIAVCEPNGAGFTVTDINGTVVTPEFILVPEVSDNNTRYTNIPSTNWPDGLPYK